MKYNLQTGEFYSNVEDVEYATKYIKDVISIYEKPEVAEEVLEQVTYEVQVHNPHGEIEGALQFGTSRIKAGDINGEFFMTKGHMHEVANRAEYYLCLSGKGLLLLMDEERKTTAIDMSEQSICNIPGNVSHRLVNIGEEDLVVLACWNSDAGHNYEQIATEGFSVRVFKTENGYIIKEV